MKIRIGRLGFFAIILTLMRSLAELTLQTPNDEPGTIGVGLAQLYSDQQPNKRGPLVVLRVVEGLPGSKAGIQRGDIVVAVNGSPVAGRELDEINTKEIRGPIGGAVRLTLARLDGSQSEMALTRVAYTPHTNATTEPFSYTVPGQWGRDPRWSFPLPWSPKLPYRGVEDLFYAPNFANPASPEYHSYLFFWWIEGTKEFTAEQLESDMLAYYRGLAEERGKTYGFTPDLSRISADYKSDGKGAPGFGASAPKTFTGTVNIYDTHGQIITLNSKVAAGVCPGTAHTAAFFGLSREPWNATIWKKLDAIRDTLHCKERN